MIGSRRIIPWWTLTAYLGLFVLRWLALPPASHGWLTVAYFVACCALVARGWGPGRRRQVDVRRQGAPSS